MTFTNKEDFKRDFKNKYLQIHGEEYISGTLEEKYVALGFLVREYITKQWIETKKSYDKDKKQVYYFSMEFLLGKLLSTSLINLGIRECLKEGLKELNIDLEELEEVEEDQGLGNGGLGRLAACFLDSMASVNIIGNGCGIRYKYGFFRQKIVDGYQVEMPDHWLKGRNVWEIKKSNKGIIVKFGGKVKVDSDNGRLIFTHINYEPVLAIPYDTPIVGYKNGIVNTLRLWSAEPLNNEFDYLAFSRGEYLKAIEYKNSVEAISQVLYPDDNYLEGRVLRLKQQYFFVSAGIQSIIRHFKKNNNDIKELNNKIAIHINDTHPSLAIPELMRILLDEEGLSFEEAFYITENTISYTNHTIMKEALEKWPVDMFKSILPRIYMIIEELNERFCKKLWDKYYGEWDKISRMAIISNSNIHMAHLAIVGSHSVNGVAKLHTEILKKEEMKEFHNFYNEKFNNKTNGITHRRWLMKINPSLTRVINESIGEEWIKEPERLIDFKDYVKDKDIINSLKVIKLKNKIALSNFIKESMNIDIDPRSIFDTQVKRIHGYKRQLLNVFNILDSYNRIINGQGEDIHPRTFIFGGKAAPGYLFAKKIIKLINSVAYVVNNDKRVSDKIKVVFLENYRVSLGEIIIPASEVSEQISTASKEASGTSNMKFMMNGALTIATLDGANIEILDRVGKENIITFGLSAKEVIEYYKTGNYNSRDEINKDNRIKIIIDQLSNPKFNKDFSDFQVIYHNLITANDEFFVLKDFNEYIKAQDTINSLYKDENRWNEISGVNIASSGFFSSDRTINQYKEDIWKV